MCSIVLPFLWLPAVPSLQAGFFHSAWHRLCSLASTAASIEPLLLGTQSGISTISRVGTDNYIYIFFFFPNIPVSYFWT